MADATELVAALAHPNVHAFLQMLRLGEGTKGERGYQRLFGGELFESFADHPRRKVTKYIGKPTVVDAQGNITFGKSITSTAAGVGQILERTWDGLVKQYGFADFTPKSQDLACVALIKGRKALDDVMAGRFEAAVKKCALEWASLPGSPYGQPTVTIAQARAEYEAAGGTYAAQPPVPSLDPVPPPPNPFAQEQPVAPFLLAALPSLIGAVPELAKIFGSDGSKAEKAEKTVIQVMDIAKTALGAKNEQELVDTITSDPQAAATVRQAVQDAWFSLVEVGGGIAAAREANTKAQGDRGIQHNPALWVSAALLLFPLMLTVDVFFAHPGAYDGNLRTQIVTGLLAVILMVGGYWLGTSASSAKKDDALARR